MKDVPFTPLNGNGSEGATVFRCTLCGTRFTHGRQACEACPLSSGCEVVSCPNCGHGFPRTSRIADWVRRLVGARSP